MNEAYKPVLYELVSTGGIALSPWSWHARMALAHKRVDADIRQHGFFDKAELEAAGGKTYPHMVEADGTGFNDSMKIVLRLEERIPDPTLFPGGDAGKAAYLFIRRHTQFFVFPALAPLVIPEIPSMLDGRDREFFVASREERFGMALDEYAKGAEAARKALDTALDPFRQAMRDGGFVCGKAPAMADYMLFGALQWARVSRAEPVLAGDDAVAGWMEGMLDLFDGLGRSVPARRG